MEVVVKPSLHKLRFTLPVCATEELRNGHHTVYSLLELYLNTLNKVVRSHDENAEAMEEFADSLVDWADGTGSDLERWKIETLKAIANALAGGGSGAPAVWELGIGDVLWEHLSEEVKAKIANGAGAVIGDGDIVWKHLSEEVKAKILEGKNLDDGVLDIKDIYITKEGQIVIELKNTDYDNVMGIAPFAKAVYDELPAPGLQTPGAPNSQNDKSMYGGLMSCADYEDLQTLKKNMPMVDDDGNLVINGVKYQLTKVEERHVDTYEYNDIRVISIVYDSYAGGYEINSAGQGKAPKSVTYTAKRQMLRDGEVYGQPVVVTETITGNTNNLGAKLIWYGDLVSGARINSDTGVVSCEASAKGYAYELGKVTVDVMIGKSHTVSCEELTVKQEPASASANKTKISLPYKPTTAVTIAMTMTGAAQIESCVLSPIDSGIATVAWDNAKKTVTVSGKTNNDPVAREAELVITTNIELKDGSKKRIVIPIEQAAGVLETYAYYGKSAGVPNDMAGGTEKLAGGSPLNVSVSSVFADGVKCHWAAVPASDGYRLDACTDEDGDSLLNDIVANADLMSGYVLYYIKSNANIQNTTNFRFVK